jgi:hypothetical protein
MSHGTADLGQLTPRSTFYNQGKFGRLFPTLPPFAADTAIIRDALTELGAPGGPMDANDDLSDPITLITDPAKSVNNPNNPTMTAGFTFLGQFMDWASESQDRGNAGLSEKERSGMSGSLAEKYAGRIRRELRRGTNVSMTPPWAPPGSTRQRQHDV